MKTTEDILYEICSDHRHYFDDTKRSDCGLTDKDMALRIVDILRVEIMNLKKAEKIVISLSNVSHVAFPKQNPHITDLVTKAHKYTSQNPTP